MTELTDGTSEVTGQAGMFWQGWREPHGARLTGAESGFGAPATAKHNSLVLDSTSVAPSSSPGGFLMESASGAPQLQDSPGVTGNLTTIEAAAVLCSAFGRSGKGVATATELDSNLNSCTL